jgi:hypothetical protein
MWARRGDGQQFARRERKEKHENFWYCNPGRAGYGRFGARIQSTNRPAKTGPSNADATADVATGAR